MSNNNATHKSKQISSTNSLLGFNTSINAASTPASSISDPNDEIWLEFLSSLQDPIPSNQSNDTSDISALNITFTDCNTTAKNTNNAVQNDALVNNGVAASTSANIYSKKKSNRIASFNFNQLIDNDDDNDPDFTILDNYELDENYDYMDDWFQVPSKVIK